MVLQSLIRQASTRTSQLPLRVLLVVPFVIEVFLAVGLTGWLAIHNGEEAVNDVAKQLRSQVTERIRQQLQTYLDTPHLINQINANTIRLGQLNLDDTPSLERYLWSQIRLRQFETVASIHYGREDGEFLGVGRPGIGSVLKIGTSGRATGGEFRHYAIDNQGNRLAEPDTFGGPYDPRVRPWYQAAVQAGRPVWSEVYTDFYDPRLVITASQPVYDTNNQLRGVLGTDLVLFQVGYFLQSINIGRSGQTFIVNQVGELIASSESVDPFILDPSSKTADLIKASRIAVPNEEAINPRLILRDTAAHIETQFGSFDQIRGVQLLDFVIKGQRQFLQVTPYTDERGLKWFIVVVVPESDFTEQIRASTRTTILLCLGALFGAVLIGLITSRWIAQPILRLSRAAQSLSQGDWDQMVPVERDDELGILAQAFNQMAEQLQASFDTLEQRNQELEDRVIARTTDIQAANKQLQEAYRNLRESEDRYRSIVENASDLIITVSLEGRFLYVSPNFPRVLGYEVEELIGQEWASLVHPIDLERLGDSLEEMANRGEHKTSPVYRLRRRDGEWRWYTSTVSFVRDEDGKPLYYVGIGRDVSDRVEAEEKLRQAKDTAEVANRAKSEFLANMSHELRTPLNGILGYAQVLLRQSSLTPQQHDGLIVIQQCGDHLLTLINDILDLSKIEARKMELNLGAFDLQELLQSTANLFQIRAEQKDIAFVYQPLSALPRTLWGDEQRLRQILINLLSNAVKFTAQGNVRFTVEVIQASAAYPDAEPQTDPVNSSSSGSDPALSLPSPSNTPSVPKTLRFQVEDTGCGIAPQDLEEIFQPFQQVGDQQRSIEGTGLGLSISQRLAEMMGSRLQVRSQVSMGSTFWLDVTLPELLDWQHDSEHNEPTILGVKGKTYKVLVVDDKPENRNLLRDVLSFLGFEVEEAVDGQDCLEKAAQFQADVILMDLVMPVLDGFEATRRIRQTPALHDTVIIATSASALDQDQQLSLAAGCNGFVPKPIHVSTLLKQLEAHLGLEWVYQTDLAPEQSNALTRSSLPDPASPVGQDLGANSLPPNAALPKKELQELYDMALIGDIRAVQEQLARLEQTYPQTLAFLNELRQLTRNFQVKKVQELLKQALDA